MKEIDEENIDNGIRIGWKFPPSFTYPSKSVETVSGLQDIRESLIILMRTRVGERIMEKNYGCDLTPLAFQQLDLNLETFMVNNIKQAIIDHEPRVKVEEVKLQPAPDGEGALIITIYYTVEGRGIPETLQYSYHPIFNK